jgi:hypothetical protein
MLKTMQMMQYFVKSGFGVADKPSFEGTPLELLMGLGQGSGAAPMGMRGVVTLAVNSTRPSDTECLPRLPGPSE